jgi:hypothetical protein
MEEMDKVTEILNRSPVIRVGEPLYVDAFQLAVPSVQLVK